MIRINLLPSRDTRRRRIGQRTLAIGVALLVVEAAGLFFWYDTVDTEAALVAKAAQDAEARVERLEKAKKDLEERRLKKNELVRQNIFFEQKKAQKTGPPEILKFLSYVLTRKEDNLYNRDEIKAQEAAGWAPGWDSDQVWLTSVVERAAEPPLSEIAVKGVAKSHEDVAEFYRRLESGAYFVLIDPVVQEVTRDEDFDTQELVSFEVVTLVTFSTEGELRMLRGDVPQTLERLIRVEAPPEGAPADGGKEGKG